MPPSRSSGATAPFGEERHRGPDKRAPSRLHAEPLHHTLVVPPSRFIDELVEKMGGRVPPLTDEPRPVLCAKPMKDEEVLYFDIPGSNLAIRVWSGGWEQHRGYCMDFVRVRKGLEDVMVNCPDDFLFWDDTYGRLESGGAGNGSTETFAAEEGGLIMVMRPNKPKFFFQLPVRPIPGAAQPRRHDLTK